MNVLIISNEILTVIGIEKIIEDQYKKANVSSAVDEDEILGLIKDQSFDVIIFDIETLKSKAECILKKLNATQENSSILIFGHSKYKKYALKFISLGASGFLEKIASKEKLILALKLITSGQLYLTQEALSYNYDLLNSNALYNIPLKNLSKREQQIFNLLLKGKRIKDISESMKIHQSTTSTLKKRIFAKFNVDNLIDLKTASEKNGYSNL
jgi:DNA-binding NarL/FixJ family response regulator